MNKVLVTGAVGFIGSNLVRKLLAKGYEVIGIDKDTNKRINISELPIDMYWKDLNDLTLYKQLPTDIDIVYHLAAYAEIANSLKNTKKDITDNVLGMHNILEFIRKNDIKKLVYTSTSSLYGNTHITPTPEYIPDIRPISQYGASKFAAESFAHCYSYLYGIDGTIFRFANVAGKNLRRGVIYDFVKKLKQNQSELEILGDGNQIKSFFHVNDCVKGIIEIPEISKERMGVYNLANKDTIMIGKLANIVCDEMNVLPKYKFTGGKVGWKGDTSYCILDITRANKLGWEPTYTCEETIRDTTRWLINAF